MKIRNVLGNTIPVKIHKFSILLFALCFYNILYAQGQTVTIDGNSKSLLQIFEQIEKQTQLSVAYNQTKLNVNQKVNANFVNKNVNTVLTDILKNTGFTFRIEQQHIIIVPAVYTPNEGQISASQKQERRITGKVTDTAGEPLIGATIMVAGHSNLATITDINGNFSLLVPENSKINISYIGYQSYEVNTQGKSSFNITLNEDSQQMDEVVVVGFGTQKKVNLTGAVTSVSLKESLGDRPLSNITSALQGVVPGLKIGSETGSPGEDMTYNIRGTTSINGGGPLVLVNNVPMDINMIDPQDIESVSILKDAASAAIYGARAAFGVILITTKQGKKDMAPKFNYNNNFSFSKASELPQKANPLESVLAYKEMGWDNDTYVDGKNITQWEGYIRDYNQNPAKYPLGYTFDEKGNLFLMKENDMFADMMENFGFMQNHNFSVSGGSQKSTYRISLGYTGEDGIVITDKDKYNRINLSSFLGVDVTKWLTTQLDLKYANSNRGKLETGGRNGLWGSTMALPSYQNTRPYEVDGITYEPETSATFARYGEPRKIKKSDFRALGRIILSPLKGLKITGEYTYNRTSKNERLYKNKYQFVGFNFTGILNSTENSSYALTQSFTDYNAINVFANYDFSIGKHDINIMGGFNQESSHSESQYSYKTDVLVSGLPSLSGSTGTATTSDSFEEYALRGLFYRINYSYAGKYMLEANGRYDGSSRFPTNGRFGFFPSFSAGWRISEEAFMKETQSFLSNLKLRASWGSIGNQILLKADGVSPENYPYIPEMEIYQSNWLVDGQKVTSLKAPLMVSSSFGWEKVYTLDFGVDISILNNRLSGTFDWYRRDTKGMLAPGMDMPWVVGTAAAKQNAADLRTRGWELEFNWRDRIKDWNYRIGFNLYDSQSEITKYNNESGLVGYDNNNNPYYRKGMKMGEIWGYVTDRFYTVDDFNEDGTLKPGIPIFKNAGKVYPGDVLYKNFDSDTETIYSGKGTVDDPGDQRIIGNSTPRFMYGISAGVSWKGFDLSVFLRGTGKRDYWRKDQIAWPTGNWGSLFKETLDFWTPDNPNAHYPRTYANDKVNTEYNHKTQSRYLANAAFLKLQNITLSYNFPKVLCKKVYFDEIKVFVSGENLYTWDHLPEGLESDMLTKNAWEYPFMRKFSLGINVTF